MMQPEKVAYGKKLEVEVPSQQRMFGGMEGFVMQQHTSECCRACCCQPNIDWTLHEYVDQVAVRSLDSLETKYFIKEDAPYCGRCCSFFAPGSRKTIYTVHEGDSANGKTHLTISKEGTCGVNVAVMVRNGGMVRCPCCCNLPYLEVKDASGRNMGRTEYLCDGCLYVPKYSVKDSTGKEVYRIRPDTCCLGCCVKCKCGGKTSSSKCCSVPFYVRDPLTMEKVGGDGEAITEGWSGWKKECCQRKGLYFHKFPNSATEDAKALLLASALLIDISVFEVDED
uniref:Phospholipid scramblase n=1 Tax=Chromera velia CCMP2878 TaxID=1169474 RepID=A0A0G4HS54_9ALVE|eukprot:Cvel_30810.t1-p1 / transcript=Cvel_30810.t1 / gene=Cvel_30810 / organism=Chromera_velia_CCMP2878 / gene_product=hypothetical protein / transcript_product=hypothetical protein / location=Cvel_scaffold4466:2833-3675(+) / protein_length=281 / sequence_SO=supercontig / SO=protein_coding / is_pseudo=false